MKLRRTLGSSPPLFFCPPPPPAEPEPLPESDELWDVDRVLITPHAVGYSHMEGVMDRMIDMLTENLKRYMRGEDLLYVIDRNKGY